jgi:adhesin transport system outer membrane protein
LTAPRPTRYPRIALSGEFAVKSRLSIKNFHAWIEGREAGESPGLTLIDLAAELRAHAAAFALALVAAGCAFESAAQALPEAVRNALRRNPELLGAAANARAAVAGYDQAAAGRWPTLDLRGAGGKEESENPALRFSGSGDNSRTLTRREGSLTLRQNVFDGSQVRSEMERQSFRLDSTRYRLIETGETVALRAVEAYLEALRDEGLVRLAEENVARHEDLLQKTQLRFKSGVGQRADAEQAGARVALARSSLVGARGAADDSAARFNRVVGRYPVSLSEPPLPTKHLPPSVALAQIAAVDNAYGVHAARAELGAAQAGVRSVRADLLPRFDIELSANRNRDVDGVQGYNNDQMAMLVMRYNLFRGGADLARIREAMERETIALETYNNALFSTEESVARTWSAMLAARERIGPLEAHARATSQVLEAYRSQFELGRRSLLDLVNAENELFQARSALHNGRTAVQVAEYRLLAAVGALVKALGMTDEVVQLDPGPRDR